MRTSDVKEQLDSKVTENIEVSSEEEAKRHVLENVMDESTETPDGSPAQMMSSAGAGARVFVHETFLEDAVEEMAQMFQSEGGDDSVGSAFAMKTNTIVDNGVEQNEVFVDAQGVDGVIRITIV